jgi:hypothetical protein
MQAICHDHIGTQRWGEKYVPRGVLESDDSETVEATRLLIKRDKFEFNA